jgi:glycosyltransferase involved in cell wall biosynthesis
MSVKDAEKNDYNSGTSFEQHIWGMQTADAVWAFVPRHHWLYDLSTDKATKIDLIPMGIDVEFWKGGTSQGKYMGNPSFLTSENQYPFKWCAEFVKVWQAVRADLDDAVIHCTNIPGGIMPFMKMLVLRYGARGVILGTWSYDHQNLRNIFKQVDFYINPVRYGDFNRIGLEAAAAGCPLITYPGNEYADYWLPEGDHRAVTQTLIKIGKGEIAPRADKLPVPTEAQMAYATINCYERLLGRTKTDFLNGGTLPDALPDVIREALASIYPQNGKTPATNATAEQAFRATPLPQGATGATPATLQLVKEEATA